LIFVIIKTLSNDLIL